MPKANCLECAERIHSAFRGNLRFISGKWFIDGREIKRLKLPVFLGENEVKYNYAPFFRINGTSPAGIKALLDMYIMMYGEPGEWLPMPIVSEAKALTDLKPMCFNLNTKQLKIVNYLLKHNEEKCIILTGVGGSGKSTFGNIVKQIFENDVGSATLSALSNPFMLEEAIKNRLVYSDELNSEELDNGVLKTLFSNQTIQVQAKGQTPYETRCQSAFLFCCNRPPYINLTDTGMLRRILYYSMDTVIKNPDPNFQKRVYSHDDLVNIVAHALNTDMNNWDDEFKNESRYNLMKNNSVFIFYGCRDYVSYRERCISAGMKPFSLPNWEEVRALIIKWKQEAEFDPKLIEEEQKTINGFYARSGENQNFKYLEDNDELPF